MATTDGSLRTMPILYIDQRVRRSQINRHVSRKKPKSLDKYRLAASSSNVPLNPTPGTYSSAAPGLTYADKASGAVFSSLPIVCSKPCRYARQTATRVYPHPRPCPFTVRPSSRAGPRPLPVHRVCALGHSMHLIELQCGRMREQGTDGIENGIHRTIALGRGRHRLAVTDSSSIGLRRPVTVPARLPAKRTSRAHRRSDALVVNQRDNVFVEDVLFQVRQILKTLEGGLQTALSPRSP